MSSETKLYMIQMILKEEPEWTMKCLFCNTLIPDHAQTCDKYGICESINVSLFENTYEFEIENSLILRILLMKNKNSKNKYFQYK